MSTLTVSLKRERKKKIPSLIFFSGIKEIHFIEIKTAYEYLLMLLIKATWVINVR
jgi:hypothetical protein